MPKMRHIRHLVFWWKSIEMGRIHHPTMRCLGLLVIFSTLSKDASDSLFCER